MITVLLFHPVIQVLVTLLAGYVLWLGLRYFLSPTSVSGSTMFSFSVIEKIKIVRSNQL